jgi:hypothetical protein
MRTADKLLAYSEVVDDGWNARDANPLVHVLGFSTHDANAFQNIDNVVNAAPLNV